MPTRGPISSDIVIDTDFILNMSFRSLVQLACLYLSRDVSTVQAFSRQFGHRVPHSRVYAVNQPFVACHDRDAQSVRGGGQFVSARRECWLDLRGTAILPDEALSLLNQVLSDHLVSDKVDLNGRIDVTELVDKVLLSEEAFVQFLSHNELQAKNTHLPLILYTTSSGSELIMNMAETKQSIPTGRIASSEWIDPLSALSTISTGSWLLIDSLRENQPVTETVEHLSNFLEFLASVSSGSTPSLTEESTLWTSPPVLPEVNMNTNSQGGLAIACFESEMMVLIDAAMTKSLLYGKMITSSTDSGILVPTGMSENIVGGAPWQTALVLPFDTCLWRTAIDLRYQQDDQDEDVA